MTENCASVNQRFFRNIPASSVCRILTRGMTKRYDVRTPLYYIEVSALLETTKLVMAFLDEQNLVFEMCCSRGRGQIDSRATSIEGVQFFVYQTTDRKRCYGKVEWPLSHTARAVFSTCNTRPAEILRAVRRDSYGVQMQMSAGPHDATLTVLVASYPQFMSR